MSLFGAIRQYARDDSPIFSNTRARGLTVTSAPDFGVGYSTSLFTPGLDEPVLVAELLSRGPVD